ncbi:hypothetical protein NT6N_10610 [Oceaniferula spumae]|uniref:Thioredoxin domain-containing protein n=1 Tax=Oceaniferula spumae TaxID=2979115 RepID=A0AAT9FIX7_9BACT
MKGCSATRMLARPISNVIFGGLLLVGVTSCDKVSEITDKAKNLFDDSVQKAESAGSAEVIVVGEDEGKSIIADESRLVLVEFYSDTCGPCRQVAPVLERLAKVNSEKVKILKVDVDSERNWAAKEQIRGIPAFQFYQNGAKVNQFTGAPPEQELQRRIDQYATTANAEGSTENKPAKPPEPKIKPMPKEWLPPGVTRG